MISFLNICPPRSGTTSFYEAFSKHPQFNVGLIKEPLHEGYKLSNPKKYLSNWNYDTIDKTKTTVLLDASPRLVNLKEGLDLKSYLSPFVDKFYYVCLVRHPKKYYTTRFFINYLMICVMNVDFKVESNNSIVDWNIDYSEIYFDRLKKGLYFNINLNEWRDIKGLSYLKYLDYASKIFNKDEIFILPIEFFDEYSKPLQEFLGVEYFRLQYPKSNRSLNLLNFVKGPNKTKQRMNIIKVYSIVKERVEESKILDNLIINDLKIIDSLYGTKLYSCYY